MSPSKFQTLSCSAPASTIDTSIFSPSFLNQPAMSLRLVCAGADSVVVHRRSSIGFPSYNRVPSGPSS